MSAYDTPSAPCPYCGTETEADWVDVGVGMQQCGPYYCENCGASQIGGFDTERDLTPEEKKTGWYKPGSPVGSSVNAVGGVPVDHKTAKRLYEIGYHNDVQLLDEKEFRDERD